MREEYKGRKFVLCLLAILLATLLAWFGKITATAYEEIVTWVVAAYVMGNVGAAWIERWTARREALNATAVKP